ncbi:hypothetical protein FGO68_gene11499 [Halteria grandinella]|uniref:Uncharacterized protein n=1 Tax=Halteria grandinella TaxID=5974 RepID=A0A8J8NMH2_HALGN|nr:hypothetical protein FGO68_gene11499 [Halteria grandinella]
MRVCQAFSEHPKASAASSHKTVPVLGAGLVQQNSGTSYDEDELAIKLQKIHSARVLCVIQYIVQDVVHLICDTINNKISIEYNIITFDIFDGLSRLLKLSLDCYLYYYFLMCLLYFTLDSTTPAKPRGKPFFIAFTALAFLNLYVSSSQFGLQFAASLSQQRLRDQEPTWFGEINQWFIIPFIDAVTLVMILAVYAHAGMVMKEGKTLKGKANLGSVKFRGMLLMRTKGGLPWVVTSLFDDGKGNVLYIA